MCYNKAKRAKDKFPPWSPDSLRRFPVLVMLFLPSHMAHYLSHTENSDVLRYSIREQMPLCIIPSAAPLEPASVRLYLQMSGTKWRCCTRAGPGSECPGPFPTSSDSEPLRSPLTPWMGSLNRKRSRQCC